LFPAATAMERGPDYKASFQSEFFHLLFTLALLLVITAVELAVVALHEVYLPLYL
jgi:hypothetical protein